MKNDGKWNPKGSQKPLKIKKNRYKNEVRKNIEKTNNPAKIEKNRKKRQKKWRPKPADLDLPKQSTTRHPSPPFQASTKTLHPQVGREKASSESRSGRTRNTPKKIRKPSEKILREPSLPPSLLRKPFCVFTPRSPALFHTRTRTEESEPVGNAAGRHRNHSSTDRDESSTAESNPRGRTRKSTPQKRQKAPHR